MKSRNVSKNEPERLICAAAGGGLLKRPAALTIAGGTDQAPAHPLPWTNTSPQGARSNISRDRCLLTC